MKRIAFLISRIQKCGPVNQLSYIVKHLDRTRFEPTIVSLFASPSSEFERAYLSPLNVSYTCLRASSRLPDRILAARARKVLDGEEIDVVHSTGLRPDRINAILRNRYRTICTLRNSPFDDFGMAYGRLKGNMLARLHLRAIRRVGQPVACSAFVSERAGPRIGPSLKTISNGVDTRSYRPATSESIRDLRDTLGIEPGLKVFLSTGVLIRRKDPVVLIEAFSRLAEDHPDWKLLLLGDGPLRSACETVSGPRVRIVGHVDDVLPWLQASDYFVSASHAEGLPNSVLEAIACGLPCALSEIQPHRYIVEQSRGQAFETFEPGDQNEMRAAIEALGGRDYKSASDDALTTAREHFSAEVMSNRYQELYS